MFYKKEDVEKPIFHDEEEKEPLSQDEQEQNETQPVIINISD